MSRQDQEHGTDAELATEEQGGKLVALQRPDSGQEEMYTWAPVGSWAQRLFETTTGQDRRHAQDTPREATLIVRDRPEETLNHAATHEEQQEHSAARTRMRDFIDAHGRADRAYPIP